MIWSSVEQAQDHSTVTGSLNGRSVYNKKSRTRSTAAELLSPILDDA